MVQWIKRVHLALIANEAHSGRIGNGEHEQNSQDEKIVSLDGEFLLY